MTFFTFFLTFFFFFLAKWWLAQGNSSGCILVGSCGRLATRVLTVCRKVKTSCVANCVQTTSMFSGNASVVVLCICSVLLYMVVLSAFTERLCIFSMFSECLCFLHLLVFCLRKSLEKGPWKKGLFEISAVPRTVRHHTEVGNRRLSQG